jgi:signal recognition particle subunit SRP54
VFESLSERLQGIFRSLRGQGTLSEAHVDAALREIRLALLEADVHFRVVKQFLERVRGATGQEIPESLSPDQPSFGSFATRWWRSRRRRGSENQRAAPTSAAMGPRPGKTTTRRSSAASRHEATTSCVDRRYRPRPRALRPRGCRQKVHHPAGLEEPRAILQPAGRGPGGGHDLVPRRHRRTLADDDRWLSSRAGRSPSP